MGGGVSINLHKNISEFLRITLLSINKQPLTLCVKCLAKLALMLTKSMNDCPMTPEILHRIPKPKLDRLI